MNSILSPLTSTLLPLHHRDPTITIITLSSPELPKSNMKLLKITGIIKIKMKSSEFILTTPRPLLRDPCYLWNVKLKSKSPN